MDLLLIEQIAQLKLVLKLHRLRQESCLLGLQPSLLDVKIANDFLQVTYALMKRIFSVCLRSNLSIVFVALALEFIVHFILLLEAFLQILRCHVLIFDQLLLVLVQLEDVTVQDLDFVERGLLNFCQVSHELLVVHLELTQVTHSVPLGVVFRELALLIAADFADRFTAALAVTDGVPIQ